MINKLKYLLFIFLLSGVFYNSSAQNLKMKNDTLTAKLISNNLSVISGSELEKMFVPNLLNSLMGRIPGLTVSQGSDEPGVVSNSLLSRGIATYTGGTQMLVLEDGFASSFSELIPEEIESIKLLKDAAETAIYGLRGANGVLLVTTKRGLISPLKVSFSTQVGFQQANRLPHFLGSYDYARLYNEALANNGVPNPRYSDTDLEAYKTGSDPLYHPDVNWYEQVLRQRSPLSKFNLNFKGGDKTVRYNVMINELSNEGLLIRTGNLSANSKDQSYNRVNVRSNLDLNITKSFSAAITLGLNIEDKTNPGAQTTSNLFNLLGLINPNSFPVYNPNSSFGGNGNFTNPLGDIIQTGYYTSNARGLNTSIRLKQELDVITKGLSISGALSFNSYYIGNSNKTKTYERFPITLGPDGNPVYGTAFGQKSSLVGDESSSSQWRNSTQELYLDYNRTFENHRVDIETKYSNEQENQVGGQQAYRHVGVNGFISYTYNNKYNANFSFGYQGSENFAIGKQYGFFPAGGLSWVASEEGFLKDNPIVSYLKFRTSYGLTGNDDIGGTRFMYKQNYIYSANYYLGTTNATLNGIIQGALANPDVTWEKEAKFNIGFDTKLFKKLDISFEYFNNNRFDILSTPNRDIPSYIGVDLPYLNVGKVNNQGFEVSATYNVEVNKDVQYYIQAQAWMAQNKIVYNSEAKQQEDYFYKTGRQIFQPYVLQALGFYTDAEIVDATVAKPTWQVVKAGDIKYKDQNGDGIIDGNDYFPIGKTSTPEVTFGLNLGCKFYGFDFSAFFQAVTNRTIYLGASYFKAFQSKGNISDFALNRWTPETAATATYPRLSAADDLNNYQSSTFWQRDGSFIKLRDVELGYTFKNLISSSKGDLRVFVNGTNLFSLDYLKVLDPEAMSGYPSVKTVSFGAKIQF